MYKHLKLSLAILAVALIAGTFTSTRLIAEESEFSSATIDLGCVVSDIEKSVTFYTKAIGFKEVPGFSVPGDYASKVGLTDGKHLNIKVLKLGEGAGATSLKLMQVKGARSKKTDNSFIHSQLGFSYLTIHVKDTTNALERLDKAGVKPIARGSQELPPSLGSGVFLTIVRDPDGNFVELVGPKS
jgi:lactoylglutathione lyase